MDEHNSLPPQSPFTQINTTTTNNNNVQDIAQLFTPLLEYQQTLLQNSQFSLDTNNIDWVSLLSGGSFTNGGGNKQMLPSSVPQTSRASSTNNVHGGKDENSWKNKRKGGNTKKSVPPRVAFHTRSSDDILDDGYKWRKYGQKAVKNSKHPRSYYRCTHHTCNVKKQIQRLSRDNAVVVTTYEGIHNHPCEKLMETLSPLLRQLQFLSRF